MTVLVQDGGREKSRNNLPTERISELWSYGRADERGRLRELVERAAAKPTRDLEFTTGAAKRAALQVA